MPEVFISHITEEAPVAEAIKAYLKRCFGQTFSVFVSSDYDSIQTGEEWYRAIVDGILGARAVIVLLSRYSVDQPWINFEAGVAVGAKKSVLPVWIRSLPPVQVPSPLAGLQVQESCDHGAASSLARTAPVLEVATTNMNPIATRHCEHLGMLKSRKRKPSHPTGAAYHGAGCRALSFSKTVAYSRSASILSGLVAKCLRHTAVK